jgi:DNA polymerase III subunit beta
MNDANNAYHVTAPLAHWRAALEFAAKGDVRVCLIGVQVEIQDSALYLVATDGHVLGALRSGACSMHDRSVIVPRELLEALPKVTKSNAESLVTLGVDGEVLMLTCGAQTLQGTALTGYRFPDWRRVVPDRSSGEPAQFDVNLLARFAKARKILNPDLERGAEGHIVIGHNGQEAGALVDVGYEGFVGVVMPLRAPDLDPLKARAAVLGPVGETTTA